MIRATFHTLIILLLITHVLTVTFPHKIVLIRHAEKPDDDSDPNLSQQGYKRASAFIKYFNATHGLFDKPVAFFAMGSRLDPTPKQPSDVRTVKTLRSIQTVQPSADWHHVPIYKQFIKERPDILLQFVAENNDFDKKTIVICWEHDEINDTFLPKLGLPEKYRPDKWPGSVYDMNYVLTFKAGDLREFDIVLQKLLPSDSNTLENKDLERKHHVIL